MSKLWVTMTHARTWERTHTHIHTYTHTNFEVLRTVLTKIQVFWDTMQCKSGISYQSIQGMVNNSQPTASYSKWLGVFRRWTDKCSITERTQTHQRNMPKHSQHNFGYYPYIWMQCEENTNVSKFRNCMSKNVFYLSVLINTFVLLFIPAASSPLARTWLVQDVLLNCGLCSGLDLVLLLY